MSVEKTCPTCSRGFSVRPSHASWRVCCSKKCMGVRNLGPRGDVSARFRAKVAGRGDDECWLWIGERNKSGYGVFYVAGQKISAHRFAWELNAGVPVPPGLQVLHSCDNPPCCNPAHLRPGTAADNGADKAARQRCADQRGERNPTARLTENEVIDIRTLRAFGARNVDLATAFGVSQQAICGIVKGRSWSLSY